MNTSILRFFLYVLLIAMIVFGGGTAITGNPLPILAGVIVGMIVVALTLTIAFLFDRLANR